MNCPVCQSALWRPWQVPIIKLPTVMAWLNGTAERIEIEPKTIQVCSRVCAPTMHAWLRLREHRDLEYWPRTG